MAERVIAGRAIVPGEAEGVALVTSEALSFWGGFDFNTGTIIDAHHPLVGVRAAGSILAVPFSKGSSTTTAVLLEAVRAGTAPAAILTTGVDSFFALASIVADVMYWKSFPRRCARACGLCVASQRYAPRVERSGEVRLTLAR
jgi:predicted aconitase with swiveling domain